MNIYNYSIIFVYRLKSAHPDSIAYLLAREDFEIDYLDVQVELNIDMIFPYCQNPSLFTLCDLTAHLGLCSTTCMHWFRNHRPCGSRGNLLYVGQIAQRRIAQHSSNDLPARHLPFLHWESVWSGIQKSLEKKYKHRIWTQADITCHVSWVVHRMSGRNDESGIYNRTNFIVSLIRNKMEKDEWVSPSWPDCILRINTNKARID